MKKYLFTALIFLSLISTKKTFSQTTQKEYLFVTKGYEDMIAKGLDMNKGYSLKDLGTWGINGSGVNRNIEFKAMYRTTDTKPCAIMMIYKKINNTNTSDNSTSYFCIPSTNTSDDIWQLTLDEINNKVVDANAIELAKAWIWALMKLSALEASK